MPTKLYTDGQLCSIAGCSFRHNGRAQRLVRGLCPKHYSGYKDGTNYDVCRHTGCDVTEGLHYGKCPKHQKVVDPEKAKARTQRWKDGHQDLRAFHRKSNLKKTFGISPEEYQAQLDSQHSKCAICGTHIDDVTRTFAVDHDHKTGALRGLLCGPCNTGLGQFKDSPERLAAAITYLHTGGVWNGA